MSEQIDHLMSGGMKPLPQCKAFLLCQEFYVDEVSGQSSLQNLIESFRFRAFPGDSAAFMIFMQLYDEIGEYLLSVALRNLSDNTSVAAPILMTLDFQERLAKMDVAFPVASLRLPRPRRYELAVLNRRRRRVVFPEVVRRATNLHSD
jgi:hypothetical protein